MKRLIYCAAVCIFATVYHTSYAQQKFQTRTADSLFNSLHKEGKFNGNVLLAENGKVLYKKSFGLANQTTKAPLNEHSMFELASCSKQFTAMAIALLQHQGKLKVEEEFAKYIPELGFYKGITINNLLYHTSGLSDYMSLDTLWSTWDDQKIANNEDMIAAYARYKPALIFETGTKHEYSNTGYMLLASIVARVSGMSFEVYVQQNIFKPLKMNRSMVYSRRYAPKKVDNYAFGYVMDDSLQKLVLPDDYLYTRYVYNFDGIVGDGGVNSTVNDLLKWDAALYTNQLLSASEMKALFTSGTLKDGTPVHYGFGWFLKTNAQSDPIVFHSGSWPGYITYIERNTKTHQTMILLQNGSGIIPKKEIKLLMDGKPLPQPAFKEIQLPETALNIYEGQYQLLPDMILTVTKEGNKLYGQATGQNRIQLYAAAEDKFFTKDIEAHLEFTKEGGQITKLLWYQGGQVIPATKIK
ncbi:serine hydrolase [Taibaiella sp. KBW10]|uniref:serine hydrolase n=1 Tax=Taibaiella sp. KBW10 TaxID=2153357 RepID=UPI000F5A60D8|nr:serine hydrolase [Taibaiella sp. KBW10]RQO31485.1 serine hydrolase [Taibaiella sp. KBW10]